MSSWPRKIYLLFWLTLIGGTGLAAVVIPRLLDSASEQGYREIDGQGRPPLAKSPLGLVATQFPVRPILDDPLASSPNQPPLERQAFPVASSTPPNALGGLPQRDVDRLPETNQAGQETVTSRARVVRAGSVYESPRTTARVLGTVSPGTVVRWVRTIEPGWEEILLRDGRLVYMLSQTISTGGERVVSAPQTGSGGEEGDSVSVLPSTVEDFLSNLRRGDLLRASTYLAPTAPAIEEPDLGAWSGLIGADSGARVGRIEPVSERGPEWRAVLLLGNTDGAQVHTTWEWHPRQERWLMAEWE